MHINRVVEEVLSEAAVELLNTLATHAMISTPDARAAVSYMPVEADSWNATIILVREIFDAEITVAGETEWLSFRILQSFGVQDGRLAYQFTPVFAQALGSG